jgi:TrmH family RNA methyltransferase
MNKMDNVHVVLVEPKNPGNIGSVVRAMKNMGVKHLRLVNPPAGYRDHDEQKMMGFRSQELIAAAREYPTLSEALQGISQVYLATAKSGKWKRDFMDPAQTAAHVCERLAHEQVALVFGRESKGVTIDECQLANYFIRIPAAVAYPSLNLSQAVMVMVYELYKAVSGAAEAGMKLPRMADKRSFERIGDNIWQLMKTLEVKEPENGLFHRSLRRALNRTHWTDADVAVFDRFCKQVRWFAGARCGVKLEEKP